MKNLKSMSIAELLKEDKLRLDGQTSLVAAASQLAVFNVESAPVFTSDKFSGLFVPRMCWGQLIDNNQQSLPVHQFVLTGCPKYALVTKVSDVRDVGSKYLIAVDQAGEYRGHMPIKKVLGVGRMTACSQRNHLKACLIDFIEAGIVATDSDGMIIIVNHSAEKILKQKKEKLIGRYIKKVFPQSNLIEILSGGRSGTRDMHIQDLDLIASESPIRHNGKVCGAVSVFQDMSKFEGAVHKLEAMRELADELNAIFSNSYDGIYITDGDGNTLRVNDAYERITGLKKKDLVGKNMREIVAQGLLSESITFKIKKTRKPMTITQKILGKKEILVSGVPVFNRHGEIKRVITSVRDMSELNTFRVQLEKNRALTSRYENELTELRTSKIGETEFISKSKKMKDTIELTLRVAKVDSNVFIQGESGVGKEIIANLIHKYSPRAITGPCIKINCGAIPSELLESELFGYELGAFTGAKKHGKPGMFEMADNGTLFLDEIAELPLPLQVKLLRVLQFKEFVRLGGVRPKKVNIRLVTATSSDLGVLHKEGKFRTDLYFRLHVVPIYVSPLRDRLDDILPILLHYLDQFNQKYRFSKKISNNAIQILMGYHWPGNVRELINVVEMLVVTTTADLISGKDIPANIRDKTAQSEIMQEFDNKSLQEVVSAIEKKVITKALKDHQTTRKVAQVLKTSQSTIVRKARKYNIAFSKIWE